MAKDNLGNLFDSVFEIKKDDSPFKEKPLNFFDFLKSKDHMNFQTLTKRQGQIAEFLFGYDATDMFNNQNTLAIICAGKGSGKDTLARFFNSYIAYVLLCMKSPQQYFGLNVFDSIDLMNVAASSGQAQDTFFEALKYFVKKWPWLTDKYKIKSSGITLGQLKYEEDVDAVTLTQNGIKYPNLIRSFSGHSMADTQEGRNILFFVLDELSSFNQDPKSRSGNALKIYRMLRTSANTRFGTKWKGICISYPRYQDDIILQLHDWGKTQLHVYADKAPTWEMKPREMFSKEEFIHEFDAYDDNNQLQHYIYQIPVDFKQDFEADAVNARRMYLCIAPKVESPFIDTVQRNQIADLMDKNLKPLIEFKDYIEDGYIKKKIIGWNLGDRMQKSFVLCIDLGETHCAAGMSMLSREGDIVDVDLVTHWLPDSLESIQVDFENIEEVIDKILDHVKVAAVIFDRWGSQYFIQKYKKRGVYCEAVSLHENDYDNFKVLLFSKKVRLPYDIGLLDEIVNLEIAKNRPSTKTLKDRVDSIITGIKVLMSTKENKKNKRVSELDGEIVGKNIGTDGEDDFVEASMEVNSMEDFNLTERLDVGKF